MGKGICLPSPPTPAGMVGGACCGHLCVPSPAPSPFIPFRPQPAPIYRTPIYIIPTSGKYDKCFIHSGCKSGATYSRDASNSMGNGWYCKDHKHVGSATRFDACRKKKRKKENEHSALQRQ